VKLFIRNAMLFCCTQVVILLVLYMSVAQLPLNSEQYLAATVDKQRLIENTVSPRIILIGGSSFAFSTDSTKLKTDLQLNPVNMGLSALQGARFMIAKVEPHLTAGDVVVISLEYEIFGMKMLNDLPSILFFYDLPSIKYLSDWEEWRYLLNASLNCFGKAVRLLSVQLLKRDKAMDGLGPYRRSGFNRYGDFVAHWGSPKLDRVRNGWPIFDLRRLASIVDNLNRFYLRCKEKNVEVFYIYPPYPKNHAEVAPIAQILQQICETIEGRLSIPLLNCFEDSLYDEALFYDSCYHLNYNGVVLRTADLAKSLKKFLQPSREGIEKLS